jgi:hypothetical protein
MIIKEKKDLIEKLMGQHNTLRKNVDTILDFSKEKKD